MRRWIACLMALCLTLCFCAGRMEAHAEKTESTDLTEATESGEAANMQMFVMAGYDTSDSGHVWDDNLFFRRMAQRTGIDFTFRESTDAEEWAGMKKAYKVGEDLPDVLFKAELTDSETMKLYESGVLIDLKPYLAEYAPNLSALLAAHPEWEEAITLPGGAIAALPQINGLPTNNIIWINNTWLNRLKLDMPTTADELTEVLRAFKTQDPNRNGKSDEVPLTFTGLWELKFLAHAFGLIGNDYGMEVKDGQVIFDYTQDSYRDFLSWLHVLYEENLIDHYGFTSLDTSRQITDSDATITYGVVFGPTIMNMLPSSAISDYRCLALKSGDTTVYRSLVGEVLRGAFAITSACRDPGAMLSWVDYLYSEEGCFLASAGLEYDEYERTSDGYWYWVDDVQVVQESILVDSTIAEGGVCPMYMSAEYQMYFDDENTRNTVLQLKALQDVSVVPYPLRYLTEEERARIAALWENIGSWCETEMTWFVTGDLELNDENWKAFCSEAASRGVPELTQVFQTLLEKP